MRLLNAQTFESSEFFDKNVPPYAILSHRWEHGEVTFQDQQNGRGETMKGWSKIVGCCRQAVEGGFEWVWIDSCCIDKSSSAELSEAINSMYRWYGGAQMCYAFLSDVPPGIEDPRAPDSSFSRSKWFTRGWTLQELLAPDLLVFYNSEWVEIGTKATLRNVLRRITGISERHLFNTYGASVAQKMSWVASRETTRLEDMAYCLMGVFRVNMPPLYGEGDKAFIRLQQEIIQSTDDTSIFAWSDYGPQRIGSSFDTGLLATSPKSFLESGSVMAFGRKNSESTFSMTNRGLEIAVPSLVTESSVRPSTSTSLLYGSDPIIIPIFAEVDGNPLAIRLRKCYGVNQYSRCSNQTLTSMTSLQKEIGNKTTKSGTKTIYIRQIPPRRATSRDAVIKINIGSLQKLGYRMTVPWAYTAGRTAQTENFREANSPELEKVGPTILWTIEEEVGVLLLLFTSKRNMADRGFIFHILKRGSRVGLRSITRCVIELIKTDELIFLCRSLWPVFEDRICDALPVGAVGYLSATLKRSPLNSVLPENNNVNDATKVGYTIDLSIEENPPDSRQVQISPVASWKRQRSKGPVEMERDLGYIKRNDSGAWLK